MARDVLIRLRGSDDLSPALKKAAQASDELERNLGDLDRDLEATGKNAERTSRSFKDMEGDLKQVGRGLGVLGAGLALSGKSFRDQEVAIDTLRRTYGDATDDLLEFSEAIQDTTNFSNDAAVAALNSFGTLARNYELTTAQIRELTQVSADLAATKGIGLVDASNRVQAAIRGEAEAAEFLGLTMNQMAIDHDNVTFSMSNAEAGAFRFNAVIGQSAFAMGAAAEQADTTYGAMVDLRDGAQDAAQSFGEMLGPFGEIGAFAADNAIQIGVMGLALRELANSAIAANAVMGTTGLLGILSRYGRFAGVGIGLTALAVDFAAATEAGENSAELFERSAEGLDLLRASVDGLAATSASHPLAALGDDVADTFEYIDVLADRFHELEALWASGDITAEQQASLDSLGQQFGNVAVAAELFVPAMAAVDEILNHFGPSAADAQAALADLDEQVDRGDILYTDYLSGVIDIADGLGEADLAARAAAAGQQELNTATQDYISLLYNQNLRGAREDIAAAEVDNIQTLADALSAAQEEWQGYADAALEAVQAVDSASEQFDTLQRTIIGNTDAIAGQFDGLMTWADGLIAVQGEYSKLDDLVKAGRITGESGVFTGMTQYAQAQQAYNTIAEQTIQVQEDIFTIQAKLAPVLGSAAEAYGEQVHAISLLSGEALLLQVGLMDAAEQQRAFDLATAAANASTDAQRQSIEGMIMSAANADPVLAALLDDIGLIDAEFDAVTGEVKTIKLTGEGFDTVGNQMDELIDAMLTLNDTQLTLVALLDDDPFTNTAADVEAKLEALNGEVAQATLAADNEPASTSIDEANSWLDHWESRYGWSTADVDNEPASGGFGEANSWMDHWESRYGWATADVVDNASATLAAISAHLNGLDGRSVTTYINTVSTFSGSSLSPLGYAGGGIVPTLPAMADGGSVPIIGAEYGPELVKRSGGGIEMMMTPGTYWRNPGDQVFPAPATRSMVGNAGFGDINVHIEIHGNVGVEDIAERLVPHMVQSIDDHLRANL